MHKIIPGKIVTATIYCLKNPIDHNRIFYVGRTMQTLPQRLSGHCSKPHNAELAKVIGEIKASGKRPTIKELQVVNGLGYAAEKYWIRHYHKKGRMLLQGTVFRGSPKKSVKHFY